MSQGSHTTGDVKTFYRAAVCCASLLIIFATPVVAFPNETGMNKAVEKAAGEAAEKAVEKAAEKAVERAAEKAAEDAAEKVVEKVAEKVVDAAVEKIVEEAVEKAAEAAEVKAEQTAKRPDEWKGPTAVHFLVFVLDIDDIDDAAQNFTTNVFIRLRWKDDRLANPQGSQRQIPLEEVWNPRVLLANRQGLVSRSLPEVVQVSPDGTVVYRQRYTGNLSQPLKLYNFPMDRHIFTIHFVAAGYRADELEFIPDKYRNTVGGAISDQLSLPDWELLTFEAVTFPYQLIAGVRAAGFAARFEARRFFSYYLWQIVLPLAVIVVMSWAAFWIELHHVGVRIAVATSSILSLIAHRFVLSSLLPRLPYMTRMDYFTVGSTLLVLMALITVVLTSFWAEKDHHNGFAGSINIWSRFAFPVGFLLLLVWFVSG